VKRELIADPHVYRSGERLIDDDLVGLLCVAPAQQGPGRVDTSTRANEHRCGCAALHARLSIDARL
jgi:hypothetical protein